MKAVLCFGDSNTYGESPDGTGRMSRAQRWTGLLQQQLGEEYLIIEEGLNGRTTVWEDPVEQDKDGRRHLATCLVSHAPLDLVVIMLGTNDLKARFRVSPSDIASSVETLAQLALRTPNGRRAEPPKVLLVSPILIGEQTFLGEIFGNRREDSMRLGPLYAEVARRNGAHFLDMAKHAEPSPLDGLHMDAESHRKAALALAASIQSLFADTHVKEF